MNEDREASGDQRLRRALVQCLTSLQHAGLLQLPKSPVDSRTSSFAHPSADADSPGQVSAAPIPSFSSAASPEASTSPPTLESAPMRPSARQTTISAPSLSTTASNQGVSAGTKAERRAALDVLNNEVRACQLCRVLVDNRTQTVFGVGNIQPRLCFFGEAPGADEDRQGEPFVGRAGQLLNEIIDKGMGLRREDVYILNVLKCRPPDNRTPLDDEVVRCRPFYERQLAILQPEFICCLGAVAAKALLQTTLSIGKLRGRFYDYHGAKVIATYHPAYLLRNPAAKKDVWEDLKILIKEMGLDVPKR